MTKEMKETKNTWTMDTIRDLEDIVSEAEYMRNSYFWSSPANAGGRRSYERQHSHDCISWIEGGREYTAEYSVSCSCKNIYASGTYTRDGQPTTLTAIRNSLKRMKAAHDAFCGTIAASMAKPI